MLTRDDNLDLRSVHKVRRWRNSILLCVWLALIFGTSCTVIRPQEFFSLVAKLTGASEKFMQSFAVFWGISWFAIVKGWHFAEFAMLTMLTVVVLKSWRGHVTTWTVVGAMLLCIAFAASDEWHQSFVPDRFGTITDVLVDSLGVLTVGFILLLRRICHTPLAASSESTS